MMIYENAPLPRLSLESYTMAEYYQSHIQKFSFKQRGNVILSISQAIALSRILIRLPDGSGYDIAVRAQMLNELLRNDSVRDAVKEPIF
jgi:hypothetical protein